jgi:hypothetical protein
MIRHRFLLGVILLMTASLKASLGQEAGDVCTDCSRRAGDPFGVRRFATPADTGCYTGYYVGGGVPVRGEPRQLNEGTWGWDYAGFGILPHRVWLQWTHGARYQGGTGSYKSDGRPIPNVFSHPPLHTDEHKP